MQFIDHPYKDEGYPYFQGVKLIKKGNDEIGGNKIKGKFDFAYDGFLKSRALPLYKMMTDSKGFRLKNYKGKEIYYKSFFQGINVLYQNFLKSENVNKNDLECLKRINQILKNKASNGNLDFNYMIAGYMAYIFKTSKNYRITEEDKELVPDCPDPINTNQDTIDLLNTNQDILGNYVKEYQEYTIPICPFISPKGAFGINTFLFLYFNNVFAIGISEQIMPSQVAHEGVLTNQIDFTLHDFGHLANISPSEDVIVYNNYKYLIYNQDKFETDMIKAFILIMFVFVHEFYPNEPINVLSEDTGAYFGVIAGNQYYVNKGLEEGIKIEMLSKSTYIIKLYKLMLTDYMKQFPDTKYDIQEMIDYMTNEGY